MNILSIIFEYLSFFIEALLIYLFIGKTTGWKTQMKTIHVAAAIGCSLAAIGLVVFLERMKLGFFWILLAMLLYYGVSSRLLSKGDALTQLLVLMLACLLYHSIDYITGLSIVIISRKTVSVYAGFGILLQSEKTRVYFHIVSKSLQFLVLWSSKLWQARINSFASANKRKLLILIMSAYTAVSVLIYLIVSESDFVVYSAVLLSWLFIMVAAITMIANIYWVENYKEQENNKKIMRYQSEIMKKSYEKIAISYGKQRSLIHDFKNHINTVEELASSNPSIEEYVKSIKKMIGDIPPLCRSGNDYIDAIINVKSAEAEDHGIPFFYAVQLPEPLEMEPTDICGILANQLDNAIEGVERMSSFDDRYVRVDILQRHQYTFFVVENSIQKYSISNETLTVSSKENTREHGIGLQNIRSLAQKYGGSLQIEISEDRFRSLVTVETGSQNKEKSI